MPHEIPRTAAEMRRRIGVRFGRSTDAVVVPEHLVLFEVAAADGEGHARRVRRIDAVAVGMLRRTGYLIQGFEIKVSRADLLQELREPAKAAAGAQYCDRWWLALADIAHIRDTDNIPAEWGLIAASGRGLRVYRDAAELPRVESPEFRAALLHAGQRSPGYRRALGYQAGFQRATDVERERYRAKVRQLAALNEAAQRAMVRAVS